MLHGLAEAEVDTERKRGDELGQTYPGRFGNPGGNHARIVPRDAAVLPLAAFSRCRRGIPSLRRPAAPHPGGRPSGMHEALVAHFTRELGDAVMAEAFVTRIAGPLLEWRPPTVALEAVDAIVVYSFGNRVDAFGKIISGPMNAQLAELTAQVWRQHRVPVYAQWEVADLLGADVGAVSIRPDVGGDGKEIYLSTQGVAAKVAGAAPKSLGCVGVIAWRDHARRAVETSRRAGMDAAVPAGIDLPAAYDPESAQSWTRDRLSYLTTDLLARFAELASAGLPVIAQTRASNG
jgi:hypothetical protein